MIRRRAQLLILATLILAIFVLYISITVYYSSTSYQVLLYNESKEIIENLEVDFERLVTYSLAQETKEYNQTGNFQGVESNIKGNLSQWTQTVLTTHAAKNINIIGVLDNFQLKWGYPRSISNISAYYTLDIPSIGLYDFRYGTVETLTLTLLNVSTTSLYGKPCTEIESLVEKENGLKVESLGKSNFKVQYKDSLSSDWKNANVTLVDDLGGGYYILVCTTLSGQPIPKVNNKYYIKVTVEDERGILVTSSTSGLTYYPTSYTISSGKLVSGTIDDLKSYGEDYMEIKANKTSTKTYNLIRNGNFSSDASEWFTYSSAKKGVAKSGYDAKGNPGGSYFVQANSTKDNNAQIDFITYQSFYYNYGVPVSVELSFDYNFTGNSIPKGANKNTLSIKLIKPDLSTITFTEIDFKGNTSKWSSYKINIDPSYFNLEGSYTLQIISHLETEAGKTSPNDFVKLNFDNINLKVTVVTEGGIIIEFKGISNTENWSSLIWGLRCSFSVGSVSVTAQLYNYDGKTYPASGDGFISYVSSLYPNTYETVIQLIETNPTRFRNSTTGEWKVKISCIAPTDFSLKLDWIVLSPTSA